MAAERPDQFKVYYVLNEVRVDDHSIAFVLAVHRHLALVNMLLQRHA